MRQSKVIIAESCQWKLVVFLLLAHQETMENEKYPVEYQRTSVMQSRFSTLSCSIKGSLCKFQDETGGR